MKDTWDVLVQDTLTGEWPKCALELSKLLRAWEANGQPGSIAKLCATMAEFDMERYNGRPDHYGSVRFAQSLLCAWKSSSADNSDDWDYIRRGLGSGLSDNVVRSYADACSARDAIQRECFAPGYSLLDLACYACLR